MSEYDGAALAPDASNPFELENVYSKSEMAGVIAIIASASLSCISIIVVIAVMASVSGQQWRQHHFRHLVPLLLSLLLADLLQAVGSIMNARWVSIGAAKTGLFCTIQGGVKQTGNVAIAIWSFILAAHAFQVLFKRGYSSIVGMSLKIVGGWTIILFIVLLGPTTIQHKENGPFYGVTGLWCWITTEYPQSQIFMEYFWGWLSAGLSLILYTGTYFRVRGNLVRKEGRWVIRRLPDEEWLVSVQRDVLDAAMHKLASSLIWFPISEFILLIPISVARFMSWGGGNVPFSVTVFCAVIFNLTGFIDAILLILISRRLPDTAAVPALTTARSASILSKKSTVNVTPFMLAEAPVEGGLSRQTSRGSTRSTDTVDTDASGNTLVNGQRVG